jgi:hypothetical protein
MTTSRPHEDLNAALAARRELGPDYDDAFVEAVAERLEDAMAARMARDPRLAPASAPAPRRGLYGGNADFALAVISLAAAVPLSASAVVNSGNTALFFVLGAIVLINFAHALRNRRG